MSNKMLYSENTYMFTTEAKITDIVKTGGLCEVIFDQTIFYPQGGGQPSDKGFFTIDGKEFTVTAVEFRDGQVIHTVPHIQADDDFVGAQVEMSIDESVRIRNSSLHSGGHLITHVLETMTPSMLPIKGYHFPDGAHVEMIDKERIGSGEMLVEANELLSQAIEKDSPIKASPSNFDEITAIRPYLAVNVPKDKPTRIVKIGDYKAVPCGGTHVNSTGELKGLKITRIKRKKENLKVNYELI